MLEGVAIGLAATALVGVAVFHLHRQAPLPADAGPHRRPGRRRARGDDRRDRADFSELGWIPQHELPFTLPQWLGSWFEIYPYYETIAAQLLAAGFVIGSYYLAEYLKVTRPLKQGEEPAVRATAAPA